MKPEEIKLSDWGRIILGDVPPEFYAELFIRGMLVYLLLTVSLRLLGRRMSTQISLVELTAMVALASAIGVPMLAFDRGILPSFIIATIIIVLTRVIARINYKSQRFEKAVQGDVDALVKDSMLCLDAMRRTRISRDRLFAHLRSENISHLGLVSRVYLEANGSFAVIRREGEQPGLHVLPDWDPEFIRERLEPDGRLVCSNCGASRPSAEENGSVTCGNCGGSEWARALRARQGHAAG